MAIFTNQARLTYRDTTTNSNIAVGEILEVLSVSKTAVSNVYGADDTITYIISIINSGPTQINNLTVTDDLGSYAFGETILVPLSYTANTIRYYVNGVLQPAPAIAGVDELTIEGISVPANGNATLVYEVSTNEFAPLSLNATITNTATVSNNSIGPVSDSEVVTAISAPSLSITKSISPVPVNDNGTVTYTFVIQNTGNSPVVATDNSFITDIFNPTLTNLTATFNGDAWTPGTEYSYDEVSGLFETTAGSITVPAAVYTQDPTTGAWSVTPGTSTLVVTGTI